MVASRVEAWNLGGWRHIPDKVIGLVVHYNGSITDIARRLINNPEWFGCMKRASEAQNAVMMPGLEIAVSARRLGQESNPRIHVRRRVA